MLKCAAIFKDGCVVQRDKIIKIWGTSDYHGELTITLHTLTQTITCHHDWSVLLSPLPAGGPYTLTISSKQENFITLTNIIIGYVYLAAGQSDMVYELKDAGIFDIEK